MILLSARRWMTTLGAFILADRARAGSARSPRSRWCTVPEQRTGTHRHRAPLGWHPHAFTADVDTVPNPTRTGADRAVHTDLHRRAARRSPTRRRPSRCPRRPNRSSCRATTSTSSAGRSSSSWPRVWIVAAAVGLGPLLLVVPLDRQDAAGLRGAGLPGRLHRRGLLIADGAEQAAGVRAGHRADVGAVRGDRAAPRCCTASTSAIGPAAVSWGSSPTRVGGVTHYDVVVLGAGPGGYVAAIRAAQLGLNTAVVEPKYWGGVCLNVGCIPSKALLRNAELAHIFTKEAKQFGISGEATFDYGVAFDRSRKVADGRVAGVHFLMKKNKITEIHGYGKFTDANTLEVDLNEGGTETVTFDNVIIATGSSTRLVPGTSLSENVVTYEKQILSRELPDSIVIAGAGRDRHGVRLCAEATTASTSPSSSSCRGRCPTRTPRCPRRSRSSSRSSASRSSPAPRWSPSKTMGRRSSVTVSKDGKSEELKADKVLQAIGFAPNVEGYGLDAAGVQAHRPQGDRHRRLHAHQRAAHLRHRRRHRAAAAGPRRRGAGRRRGRNHRRRRDFGARRLPDDAARDVLPAAGRQLRAHRGAGPRRGLRRQGRQVPVHRQRQGARRSATRAASSS